jgi:thiamine-monophosphate kinase
VAESLGEFALIQHYFAQQAQGKTSPFVTLGIGDDCALLRSSVEPASRIAISTDLFAQGRHFFQDCNPADIGYKALAVNLSDLAAMGATPRAFTLALSLPNSDSVFLQEFARGLFELANQYECRLIGGDTTKGPLTICITVLGEVNVLQALRRDAAMPGQDVWVTGELGAAGLAVFSTYEGRPLAGEHLAQQRLLRPQPRVAFGQALLGLASAAIDLSDGLVADIAHIATASHVEVHLVANQIPMHPSLRDVPIDQQLRFMLAGGDDYELAFCADSSQREQIHAVSKRLGLNATNIGHVQVKTSDQTQVVVTDLNHQAMSAQTLKKYRGYEHF